MPSTESRGRRHLVTIAVEDYFQVGSFNRLIQRGEWYRFEPRGEANPRPALDLLDEFGVRGTFFVLGWIADTMPELIAEIARRGHEVASKGYYHRSMRAMTPGEFREDLARAREALRRASGQRVLGYRAAGGRVRPAAPGRRGAGAGRRFEAPPVGEFSTIEWRMSGCGQPTCGRSTYSARKGTSTTRV